ncbi:ATP-dependent DNA helicase chl1 [Tulasnella sp. 403]|nr:ATP-dependent DNA helicase chl1 [Tulasnella sp. 403]
MDKFLADWLAKSKSPSEEEMLSVQQFVEALGSKVQEVNLLEIDKYLRESKIARKVSGYCEKVAEEATKDDTTKQSTPNRRGRPTPPLHSVESFLLALTTPSKDGRIFVSRAQGSDVNKADVVHLKYQLLNPSDHFQEVVSAARSVILAGGTMQPISDLQTQLFSSLEGGELNTFSCGHVIPKNNLRCVIVEKGPRGRDMTFRFEQRGDRELMVELGQLLKNFVNVIPSGVVVFFPSYAFLNNIKKVWEENGVLEQLAVKKKVRAV